EPRTHRSADVRPSAALSGAAAAGSGDRGGDDPPRRSRRGLLPRLRPARGPRSPDHRSRQRHRPCGGDRLRPRGRRRAGVLPRRARGRRRDRAPGGGLRAARDRRGRRHRRRGPLPAAGAACGRRAGRPRLPRQQRRLPADARLHRGASQRGDRAHLPHQHPLDVLALQGRRRPHEAGLDDHQHELHPGLSARSHAAALLDDQGRDRHLHQGARAGADAQGHPRELGRSRAGVDAADPHVDAAGEDGAVRSRHADPAGRAAGRARAPVRLPGLRRVALRLRRDPRGHRRRGHRL
ncbi:MAG: Dehydrogenases with different specificities (related to short-chain alcohol dehydrogenases), partial [uncultured Solirubrobacteraceae bacterium]